MSDTGDAAAVVVIETWEGDQAQVREIDCASVDEVADAFTNVPPGDAISFHVVRAGEENEVLGGGGVGGRYVLVLVRAEGPRLRLVSASPPEGELDPLPIGGEPASVPAEARATLDEVREAAKWFVFAGGPNPALSWAEGKRAES